MSGVCVCAAALHLFAACQRPSNLVHMVFGAMCLVFVPFSVTQALTFQATELTGFVAALKWNIAFALVFCAFYLWFIALYTRVRPQPLLLGLSVFLAMLFVLNLVQPYSLQYEAISEVTKTSGRDENGLTYAVGRSGTPAYLTAAGILVLLAYSLYAFGVYYRRERSRHALAMLLAVVCFACNSSHGIAVRLGLIAFVQFAPLGYVAVVVIMSGTQFLAHDKHRRHVLSKLREREDEVRFLNRIYSTLSQTNQLILRSKNECDLFHGVCQIAVQSGGMTLAWIGVEDPHTHLIEPAAVFGEHTDYLKGRNISSRPDIPEGRGPTGTAFRENRASFIHNFHTDPRTVYLRARMPNLPWGSSGSIPIRRGGKPYAAFSFYDTRAHAFSEKVTSLLQEMANDIEQALTRMELEQKQARADEALRIAAIAFESQEGMIVCGVDGNMLRANESISRMTGYCMEELVGRKPQILFSDQQTPDFYERVWAQINQQGSWAGEVWCKRKDDQVFPVWLNISTVRDAQGAPTHFVVSITDITGRKQAEAQISRLAYYDPLTELPNRQLMMERLQQAILGSSRSGGRGAVLFLDLNNFKAINDTLGHEEGDKLLQEMARRLRTCVREVDTVARFGGDEFIVLLENLDDAPDRAALSAKKVADKLLKAISQPCVLQEKSFSCSASIGVALWQGNGATDIHELLKHADVAMYEAKKVDGSAVCFFDPQMQIALEHRTQMETKLRQALSLERFTLHFQRRVDDRGVTRGAEVLLRWVDPEQGIVSPGQFIGIAEDSGLIVPIGRWVVQGACRQLKSWAMLDQTRKLRLSVNISPKQFAEENFVSDVTEILAATGADPVLLELEITEGLLLQDVDQIIPKMEALRALGVSFAIDDFGTGYSSLSYLQRLPINVLKIDQSFVRDMPMNRSSETIVRTIIQMGQSLELEVIAEGVETEQQRAMLAQRGCFQYQGFLFGRPVPVDVLERELHSGGQVAPALFSDSVASES